jgi:hypothetical protein
MKPLLFFAMIPLSLAAAAAQAVPVKDCPQEFSLELQTISPLRNVDIEGALEEGYYVYNRNEGIVFSYEYLGQMGKFAAKLKLTSAKNAVCRYDGGTNVFAVISGSLREGARRPAVLSLYWNHELGGKTASYMTYLNLQSLKPLQLKPMRSSLIYFPGLTCNNAECGPRFFRIGSAGSIRLAD